MLMVFEFIYTFFAIYYYYSFLWMFFDGIRCHDETSRIPSFNREKKKQFILLDLCDLHTNRSLFSYLRRAVDSVDLRSCFKDWWTLFVCARTYELYESKNIIWFDFIICKMNECGLKLNSRDGRTSRRAREIFSWRPSISALSWIVKSRWYFLSDFNCLET